MSILPQTYDNWKLQTPEEFHFGAYRANHPDICPSCGAEYYGEERSTFKCAQCGAFPLCQECSSSCECGKTLCANCAEEIDGMILCADCKVEHLHELEEAARVEALEKMRRTGSFEEKSAIALDWALGVIGGERC